MMIGFPFSIKINSTFVEYKFILYVCRSNSKYVEHAVVKIGRGVNEYPVETEKSLYEGFTG